MPQNEQLRWILVSNFNEIDIHDMNHPLDEPTVIKLEDLPTKFKSLEFLVDISQQQIINEKQVSIDAGNLVAKIYDELANAYAQHADIKDPKIQQSLNMLIVRIVFLLYADDTSILGDEDMFQKFLERREPQDIRNGLIKLFKILDTPDDKRDPFDSDEFTNFSYVNGGMFANEDVIIPQFTPELKSLIVNDAGRGFNWSGISPTIFGAVFESTLNPEERRSGGMHYTSIENIHKVIDPLFLNDLRSEFDKIQNMGNRNQRIERAKEFQDKLAKLKFFDPACGAGNFLTETYLSLRKMENECIKIIYGNQPLLATSEVVKIKIQNFYGIEINDFAVSVARTAMWIAENQMLEQTKDIVYYNKDFLPLDSNDSIYEGNALRMNWGDIVKPYELNYIMGNPPFIGKKEQSKEQKQDLRTIFNNSKIGTLDYVTGWYIKATDYIQNTTVHVAFVSTNSISQGEQVPKLWSFLEPKKISINFAYRSFVWDNEAKYKAHVHVIIIGFSTNSSSIKDKIIFDEKGKPHESERINPYLLNAPNVLITNRTKPLCNVKRMSYGSMPIDDGNLILSAEERETLLKKDQEAGAFIKPYYGGKELLHNEPRYCLWLVGVSPSELKNHSLIIEHINKCREYRMSSNRENTVKAAQTPMLFGEIRQPGQGNVIVLPKVSSEKREYIPSAYLSADNIINGSALLIKHSDLTMFGILNSVVHNAWMRVVAGRLETRYQYSARIVYNNFPWPSIDDKQKGVISKTAQSILDVRKLYPDSSLADLYDPLTMPVELRKAHEANDKAVLKTYGLKPSATEAEIVQHLFKMYEELVGE